ncbi:hypothetical protein [Vibrio sinaloensis]|uniref:hypothetical protein n=1 Tax=Photobacterium sp. (strain ATCC 43367) TaxID=379097 RepID=UPI00204CB4BD|nr:hypothetical protein [Vibrio sinaloensis]UPQ87069.1 hypothetical protein MTO69_08490 [Vibrio sinaloensis]
MMYSDCNLKSASQITGISTEDLLRYAQDEYVDIYLKFTKNVRATTEVSSLNELFISGLLESEDRNIRLDKSKYQVNAFINDELFSVRAECEISGMWSIPSYCVQDIHLGTEKFVNKLLDKSMDIVIEFDKRIQGSIIDDYDINYYATGYDFGVNGIIFDEAKVFVKFEDIERIKRFHKNGKWLPKFGTDLSKPCFEKGNVYLPPNRKSSEEDIILLVGYLVKLIENPELYGSIKRSKTNSVSVASIVSGLLNELASTEYSDKNFSTLDRYISFARDSYSSVVK